MSVWVVHFIVALHFITTVEILDKLNIKETERDSHTNMCHQGKSNHPAIQLFLVLFLTLKIVRTFFEECEHFAKDKTQGCKPANEGKACELGYIRVLWRRSTGMCDNCEDKFKNPEKPGVIGHEEIR